MRFLLASICALALAATSAGATGEGYCRAVDGSDAEFGYTFGRVPGLALVGATIRVGDRTWSVVETEGAIPITVAQNAQDGRRTIIDFADPQYTEILASIRIISAVEGDDYRAVGTMQITDVGVFAMICE